MKFIDLQQYCAFLPISHAVSRIRGAALVFTLAIFVTGRASATTYFWDQNSTLGGTGTWDASSPLWLAGSASGVPGVYGNDVSDGAVFAGTAGTVTIADSTNINANALTFSTGGYTIAGGAGSTLTLSGATPTIQTLGVDATISAILTGAAGLRKTGEGILLLNGSAVNSYTGATNVSGGTLKLDFSNLAAPTNLINAASALQMAGGTLEIAGKADVATSQTFASTAFQSGRSAISAAPASGTTLPTLALGNLTATAGAAVQYTGVASSTGVSSATGQTGANGNTDLTGAVAATATITTGTAGGTNGILSTGGAGAYSTVGLYDFAAASGGAIVGLSQAGPGTTGTAGDGGYRLLTGGTLTSGSNSINYDITAASLTWSAASSTADFITMRFNSASSTSVDWARASNVGVSGILVTPNVGANNVAFINSTVGNQRSVKIGNHTAGSANSLAIWQNNTSGFLRFDNGIIQGGGVSGVVQNGAGTVVYGTNAGAALAYTAPTFLNGGVAEIASNQGIGDVATAATLNLNGGTLVGTATLTLDNAGANQRPVNLQSGGGGLGALTGTTMTVSGVVSGTGPLAIGLAASVANGNVTGQVPGTGIGTANTTSQIADGIVLLSGANTFSGNTTVLSGTLEVSVTGSLSATPSVFVNSGASLTLDNNLSLNDTVVLSLAAGSTINLNFSSGSETVTSLFLNSTPLNPGLYTVADLALAAPSITFAGSGAVTVLAVPEPQVWSLLCAGVLLVLFIGRRRSAAAREPGT